MKINGVTYSLKSGKDSSNNDAVKVVAKKGNKMATISIYAGSNNIYESTDKIKVTGTLPLNSEFITEVLETINGKSNNDLNNIFIERPEDSNSSFIARNIRPQSGNSYVTFQQLLEESNGVAETQREEARAARQVELDAASLKEMGFSEEQAKFISEKIATNALSDDNKNKVIEKLKSIKNAGDDMDITQALKQVYSYVFLNSKRNAREIADINGFVYGQLDNLTNDDEDTKNKIKNGITSYNVLEVWNSFNYTNDSDIKNILQALYDDFNDTPSVISVAYNHILDCIIQRAEKLGVELDETLLSNAATPCAVLTESSASDDKLEAAMDAIPKLLEDLKNKEAEINNLN